MNPMTIARVPEPIVPWRHAVYQPRRWEQQYYPEPKPDRGSEHGIANKIRGVGEDASSPHAAVAEAHRPHGRPLV
jgi:hypothetical protein